MRKTVIGITRIIHGVLVVLIFLAMISLLPANFGETSEGFILRGLSVYIPFFVSLIAAEKCRSFLTFFPICLVSLAAPYFLTTSLLDRVLCLAISAVIILIRIAGRLKDRYDALSSPYTPVLALFIVFFILSGMLNHDTAQTIIYYSSFVYVMDLLVYTNLTRLETYLSHNDTVTNIPYGQIARSNRGLLTIFLSLTAAAMVLMPLSGIDRLLKQVGRMLLAFLRRLFSGAPEEVLPEESEPMPPADMSAMLGAFESGETPEWLRLLLEILQDVIFIGAILLVLAGIVYAVYRFVKRFYRPSRETSDVTEFISPHTDKKESLLSETDRKHPLWLSFDPVSTVRKTYRRTILRQKKPILSDAFTPEELENYAEIKNSAERETLHTVYEKARYSETGVTKEEARSLHA